MKRSNEKDSLYLFLAYVLTLVCVLLIVSAICDSNIGLNIGAGVIFLFTCFVLWVDAGIEALKKEQETLKKSIANQAPEFQSIKDFISSDIVPLIKSELKVANPEEIINVYKEHNKLLKEILTKNNNA